MWCVCSSASAADDEREEKKLLDSSGTDARTSLQVMQEDNELGKLREGDRRRETETEAQLRELLKTEREQKVVLVFEVIALFLVAFGIACLYIRWVWS